MRNPLFCVSRIADVFLWMSVVVVGLAAEDGSGTVYLLDNEQAHHLVRECHARQRKHAVATVVDGLAEAVRTTDNEHKVARQFDSLARQKL